jgi:hypothetical protein
MALFAHPILLATGSALVILLLFFFVEYLIECGDVKKGNFITLAPFEWSYESVDGPMDLLKLATLSISVLA